MSNAKGIGYGFGPAGESGGASDIEIDVTTVTGGTASAILFTNAAGGTIGDDPNFLYTVASGANEVDLTTSSSTATRVSAFALFKKGASDAALANGDRIGTFGTSAWDGTAYQSNGRISMVVDGAVSSGVVPTAIEFVTSATATISGVTRMFISSGGNVGIGFGASSTTLGARLDVKAPGALVTSIAFRARNSADTGNLVQINGHGIFEVYNGTAPTSSVVDGIEIFSTDYAAGDARMGLRTETGKSMYFGNHAIVGNEEASGNFTLMTTSNATKGKLLIGTSAYDEVNNRWGVGTSTPDAVLDVQAAGALITDVALRVRNSADSQTLFEIDGDGSFYNRTAGGSGLMQMLSTGGIAIGLGIVVTSLTTHDVCIGENSIPGAAGDYKVALGSNANAGRDRSVAIGAYSAVTTGGEGSVAIGANAKVTVGGSTLIHNRGESAVITNNIADSFMWSSSIIGAGNYQSFFVNKKSNLVLYSDGQLVAGTNYETAATNTITVRNGTNPTAVIVDSIQISAKDSTQATPKSTLSLFLEQPPIAGVGISSTDKVPVWINGVEYYIPLTAV